VAVANTSRELQNSLIAGAINIVVGTSAEYGNRGSGAGVFTTDRRTVDKKTRFHGIQINTAKHDPKKDRDVLTHEVLHILNQHHTRAPWNSLVDWLRIELENYLINWRQIPKIRSGKAKGLEFLLDGAKKVHTDP